MGKRLTELHNTVLLWMLHMDCKSTKEGCDNFEQFKLDITYSRPANISCSGKRIQKSRNINPNTLANKTGYKRKPPGILNSLFNPLAPEFSFKFQHILYLKCEYYRKQKRQHYEINGILKRKKRKMCSMFKIFSKYIC